jgi:hypothetical protein
MATVFRASVQPSDPLHGRPLVRRWWEGGEEQRNDEAGTTPGDTEELARSIHSRPVVTDARLTTSA